jgi:hypothetical protein
LAQWCKKSFDTLFEHRVYAYALIREAGQSIRAPAGSSAWHLRALANSLREINDLARSVSCAAGGISIAQ